LGCKGFSFFVIYVVLDTNVLLAALRSKNGASHQLLLRFLRGEFRVLISNTVLSEYEEILKREGLRFGLTSAMVDRFLDALCSVAQPYSTSALWKPFLPDPDDEAFAQLALEAKVGYLVTHNRRHFPASQLPALRVVSPGEFLHHLQTLP